MKYRIRWTSKLNGNTGHGTGEYPKKQAEMIAKNMNSVPTPTHHTIEPVENTDEIQNNLDSENSPRR